MLRTMTSICEEFASWLKEKPYERSVVVKDGDGEEGFIYWGESTNKERSGGILMQCFAKEVSFTIFPDLAEYTIVRSYESVTELTTHLLNKGE